MATFTFDGSESITTPFNVATDRVIFNLNAEDFALISEDRANNTVSFVTTSGAVLTLTSTNFAAISPVQAQALVPGIDSDIIFAIGTRGDDVALSGNVVVGLEGIDVITGETGEAGRPGGLLLGNQGDDTITNDDLFSVNMFGGQGNDTLTLTTDNGSDESLLVGGLGDDTISVTAGYTGNVTIFGGNGQADATDGADEIAVDLGAGGTALVFANAGDDEITITGTGMASVFGGLGNDAIAATVEGGEFVGGLGTDTITITSAGTPGNAFTVFGGNGEADAADGRDVISLTLQDSDTALVYGNGGNDVITIAGDAAQVTVFGGQGNDAISGTVGDDSLVVGGVGSDAITLTVANQAFDDTLGESEVGSHITVFGGNGMADATDGADSISVTLDGDSRGADAVVAQSAEIFGNGGDDEIVLLGQGSASVFGGQGNDTITAGDGLYSLTGGQGEDRFDFSVSTGINGNAPLTETTVAADVSRITDLNFDEDEIALAVNVTSVINASGTATAGATLADAAVTAFNGATTQLGAVETAVIFSYQGEQFLAQATAGAPVVAAGIDTLINITGFTGTIDANDFVVA